MRITYSNFEPAILVKKLIQSIKENNISIKNMIRNYAANVIKERDEILNSAKLDINDWINDDYNDSQINIIINNIKEKIVNIRKN